MVESQPVLRAGVPPPDTRVLKSQAVLLHMRDGGEEIDRVEADSPGHIDFLPNRPDSRKRTVDGNMMTLHYGTANQIRQALLASRWWERSIEDIARFAEQMSVSVDAHLLNHPLLQGGQSQSLQPQPVG